MAEDAVKAIARNKKAYRDYAIFDKWEAGIVLVGTEVKSLRNGQVQMADAYARIDDGEIYLVGLHISPYDKTAYDNHEPDRKRKLLLHRREIRRIRTKVQERGFTLLPLRLYFRRGLAKVEIGLARGKRQYDKRQDIKKRDHERQMARATSRRR
jgi:SsrA-binding protein